MKKLVSCLLVVLLQTGLCGEVKADTFGSGVNSFEIEFVPIGDICPFPRGLVLSDLHV